MSNEFRAEWLDRPVQVSTATYGTRMHALIEELNKVRSSGGWPEVRVRPLLHRLQFELRCHIVPQALQPSIFIIDADSLTHPAAVLNAAKVAMNHFLSRRRALRYLEHGQRPIAVELHPELWAVVCTWQETQNDAPVPCRLHYTAGLDIGRAAFHATAIRVVDEGEAGGQQPLQNKLGAGNPLLAQEVEADLDKLSELSGADCSPFETTTIDGFEGDWVIFIVPFNT